MDAVYKVYLPTTCGACLLVATVATAVLAQDTPWTPPDPSRPPVATTLPSFTGGERVPGPPVAPTATARPSSWPGGPTPQPPGDELQRRPAPVAPADAAASRVPFGPTPATPAAPPYGPELGTSPNWPLAAPAATVADVYRDSLPPAYAPPSSLPPPPVPLPPPAAETEYLPPAYAPPGVATGPVTAPVYPPAAPSPTISPVAPIYPPVATPPAVPAYPPVAVPPAVAPQPVYPRVGQPVTLVPPSAMPATAPLSPAPPADQPIPYVGPVAAMPLVPCERALMVAAVGSEAILASDLLAMAEENMERNMKQHFETQRKKLVDAGREDDVESMRRQLEQEQKRWMEELRTAINEAAEGKLDPERMTPDQKARQQLLDSLLKQQVELKLAYYDAKRKIPKENMPGVEKQITKHFDEVQVPRLLKDYDAESYRDLDVELRRRGTSLERERRGFIERSLAQQWIQQQVKADEEASFEEMVAYYRDHPTEFDKPANTRWQLLNVSLARYPSRREAYAKIADLGNRILSGQDFAAVAKEGSDGGGGSDGKMRDWPDEAFHVSDVVKQAIEGLPPGQMSTILEDWRGYYIVRVVERTAAHRQSFEVAQSVIRQKIKQLRHTEQTDKYIADLRKSVPVWTVLEATQTAAKPTNLLRY